MKKAFLLVILTALVACTSPMSERPFPVNKYAEPAFVDTASFTRIRDSAPIVEKVFLDYAEKNHFPAIAFAVVTANGISFSGASGFANLETRTPATTGSLFRIASMSKSFTAMAILKLRDEGKLSLSDKVSKYIRELDRSGLLTTDAPDITILHLLTMSAGFPEDNPWGDRQLEDTDAELLELIGNGISYSNTPGLTFEYSNLGFAMLGRIISVVSGTSYQEYITENIMKPIGMTQSRWDYEDVPQERLALGYRWEENVFKLEPFLHDGAYGSMGGLICSIDDFTKYISLHLAAWPPRDDQENGPVRRSSIREMHQPWRVSGLFANATTRNGVACPAVTGYGYGLGWRKDCNDNVRVSHSGGLPGFGSEWRIYPEYGIGVVSFSNRTYGAPGLPNAIALDTLIHLAGLKPRNLPTSEVLEARKRQLVEILTSWSAEGMELLAENFFLDQSLESWKTKSAELFEAAGAVKNITSIKAENQLRGTFTIEGEKKTIIVFFTLTPEREAKIQYVDMSFGED